MKNQNILITVFVVFTVAMFIFGFANKSESNTNKGILTMRTSETINGMWDNSITIIYEDGKMEKNNLKTIGMRNLSVNLITINQNLNNIISKGYQLISSSEGGSEGVIITTYTFKKD